MNIHEWRPSNINVYLWRVLFREQGGGCPQIERLQFRASLVIEINHEVIHFLVTFNVMFFFS